MPIIALRLERREQENKTTEIGPALLAPLVDEDYWAYRVTVGEHQNEIADWIEREL